MFEVIIIIVISVLKNTIELLLETLDIHVYLYFLLQKPFFSFPWILFSTSANNEKING